MWRGRRAIVIVGVILALVAALFFGVRWALGPENLARVITGWVERELGAELKLGHDPSVRLIPRLQLSLSDVRLERNGDLVGSVGELNVALPWSALWSDGLRVESLSLEQPVIALPALRAMLADLSVADSPTETPMLPRIAVGIRIEDGSLLSGAGDDAWRLDRISMVTTPLRDGLTFHLDAGAMIRGPQNRTLSLTLNATPATVGNTLSFDGIDAKLVVSPDNQQLDAALAAQLRGRIEIDPAGLKSLDLDGDVPGWPDWLPNVLDFAPDQPTHLLARWLQADAPLQLSLSQGDRSIEAQLDAADLQAALKLADRPLLALSAVRSHWRTESLAIAGVRLEGIRVDVVAEDDNEATTTPAPADSAGADDHGRR